jgi:hypothetical protein
MKYASAMLTNVQIKNPQPATKTAIKLDEVELEFRVPAARSFARTCRLLGQNLLPGMAGMRMAGMRMAA